MPLESNRSFGCCLLDAIAGSAGPPLVTPMAAGNDVRSVTLDVRSRPVRHLINPPDLTAGQRALVIALVAGGPVPDGLDERHVAAVEQTLLPKRAGEVAADWPLPRRLIWAAVGTSISAGGHRLGRRGARCGTGWLLARDLAGAGRLPELAETELAARGVLARIDREGTVRARRLPAARRVTGGVLIGFRGEIHLY
ncbi:MAG: hypothetical protein JO100_14930 [Pseudonocardia sp.]|nr:hypothetical protein [Pseudonocardia sp.]